MDLEKFEIESDNTNSKVVPYNDFTKDAKNAVNDLVAKIKKNIKDYRDTIEKTNNEINDNKASKEKCENEISNMKGKISRIRSSIDNVQNTYKKMVDAYSTTSKGETRDIYSDIISGAKTSCEKDVEKSKNEIVKLNSDIEAIKNNIAEFTKTIDSLNVDLAKYNDELNKYTKARDYMENISDKMTFDLDNILAYKENSNNDAIEVDTRSDAEDETDELTDFDGFKDEYDNTIDLDIETPTEEEPKEDKIEDITENKDDEVISEDEKIDDTIEPIVEEDNSDFDLPEPEETKEEVNDIKVSEPAKTNNAMSFDDSLKQIYDLTGYTPPKKEEEKKEEPEKIGDVKPQEPINDSSSDFSEWEKILNGGDEMLSNLNKDDSKSSKPDETKTLNELLKPYGTTYEKLTSLTSDEIEYKDGTKKPYKMEVKEVLDAINNIDGTDLKNMKIVGPEITILKKVKSMKEGK